MVSGSQSARAQEAERTRKMLRIIEKWTQAGYMDWTRWKPSVWQQQVRRAATPKALGGALASFIDCMKPSGKRDYAEYVSMSAAAYVQYLAANGSSDDVYDLFTKTGIAAKYRARKAKGCACLAHLASLPTQSGSAGDVA